MRIDYVYNEKLKGMIHKRGLKNNWIATQVGVDAGILTKWITGEREPTIVQKTILAGVLNCQLKEIFNDI